MKRAMISQVSSMKMIEFCIADSLISQSSEVRTLQVTSHFTVIPEEFPFIILSLINLMSSVLPVALFP